MVISAFICAIISCDTQQELWSFQPLSVQSFQVVHSKSCGHFSLYLCNHFRWYTARVVVISAFICAIISGDTQQELWSFQPLYVQSFQVVHSRTRVLDLSECDIGDCGLSHIAKTCKLLIKIDLNSAKANRTTVSSAGR